MKKQAFFDTGQIFHRQKEQKTTQATKTRRFEKT
jgi:hypothetical protein